MTKITAPNAEYNGEVGGVRFVDGVAETDNEAVIAYCRAAGYGIGSGKPRLLEVPEVADPREVADASVVGTRLRDAAVDPQPTDFLPPTNAGQANPHGPLVVSPGIHGIETQVVRPGPVYVEDLAAQQAAETRQAEQLLVERRNVADVIPTPADADRGPLGLSDPGSVVAIETGDATDEEDPTNPDGSPDVTGVDPNELRGQALDDALTAAGLSKTGTADEKRARLAEHTSGQS